MRLFSAIVAVIVSTSSIARADPVRVDFAPSDPGASLVATRFVPVEQHWTRGPLIGGFTLREAICAGACSRILDNESAYHVAAPGLTSSRLFLLPKGADRLRLSASLGNQTARDIGGVFTFSGVACVAIGVAFLGVHLLSRPIGADSPFRTTGAVGVATGTGFLALGLPFYLANGTSVSFH